MIQLQNLSKIYQNKGVQTKALHNINLTINQGEFIMIHGQSGSGKTTLLNILGLMDKPTGGQYLYGDKDMSLLSKREATLFRNREIGFVFQGFNLIPSINVIDNVEMPLGYRGTPYKNRRERSIEILENVGLSHKIKSYPPLLSGGEQQRVAIARALVGDANLILADEPTGNLDSVTAEEIMKLLSSVHKQGKTIIMISHNKELASYATRVLNIRDGGIKSLTRTRVESV